MQSPPRAGSSYRGSWPEQGLDGTAFVRVPVPFGDVVERNLEVENLAGIDGAVEGAVLRSGRTGPFLDGRDVLVAALDDDIGGSERSGQLLPGARDG